jgi:hypothetical protein
MGWDGLISKGLEGVGSLSLPAVSKSPGATLAFALKANFVNRIFGFWDCGRSPKKHPHQNEEITDGTIRLAVRINKTNRSESERCLLPPTREH